MLKKIVFKKLLIKIIILLIIMLILYFAIRIIYNQQPIILNSEENALYIIDGDTLETSDGETIRLLCVDTPEEGEEGYEEAKNFLSAAIVEANLTIERQGTDKYNRTLAWIIVDENILLNKEIVNQGFGNLFEYNNTNCERMK